MTWETASCSLATLGNRGHMWTSDFSFLSGRHALRADTHTVSWKPVDTGGCPSTSLCFWKGGAKVLLSWKTGSRSWLASDLEIVFNVEFFFISSLFGVCLSLISGETIGPFSKLLLSRKVCVSVCVCAHARACVGCSVCWRAWCEKGSRNAMW